MFRRTAIWLALAAIALASIEAAAVRAALPRAREALNAPRATSLFRAARGAAVAVGAVAESHIVTLGGNLVLGAVEGTTRVLGIVANAAEASSRCAIGAAQSGAPGCSRHRVVVVRRAVLREVDRRVRIAI